MENAHERDSETVHSRRIPVEHDIKEQPVRAGHLLKNKHVDLGQCVIATEDEAHSKKQLHQHEGQVFDDSFLDGKCYHSRSPSRVSSNDEEGTASASLPEETGYGETRTGDDRHHERLAAFEKMHPGRKFREAHTVKARTGQSQPLLLPPNNTTADKAIQRSNTRITVDGVGIRISSDSLCSPTAFSVAATAASLTCSSPPSCTSLGDQDSITKASAEGEARESAIDLQRQHVIVPFSRRQVSLSGTSMHMGGVLPEDNGHDGLQVHQPRIRQRNSTDMELLQSQGQECEAQRRHNESRNGAYEMVRCLPDHLLRSAGLHADAGDKSGDDAYEQNSGPTTSPPYAIPTARRTERHIQSEAPGRLLMPATVTEGATFNTAGNWVPSASLEMLQSQLNGGEVAHPPHFPAVAAGEDEVETLTATTTAGMTAGPGPALFARDQECSTAALGSDGSSTPPRRGLGIVRQRFNFPSKEADLSCFQPDTPDCCFCTSVADIAFPPPPARLVAKFIAYVFEPQLQRLQRRLEKDARHHCRGELGPIGDAGEGVRHLQQELTSTAPASTRVSTGGLLSASATTASPGDAEHPEHTQRRRDRLTASKRILQYCTTEGKQAKQCACTRHAETCDIYNLVLEGRTGKENLPKSTSRATHQQRKGGEVTHMQAAESGNASYAATSAAGVATPSEKCHQSALLALQLKQHLLSLVCYMERLLKRGNLAGEESARTWISSPNQTGSSNEGHRPDIFYQGHCRQWKHNDQPPASGRTPGGRNQFSFHIEQLLRAEIVVQAPCPIPSPAKCECAFSSPETKSHRASSVAVAERDRSANASTFAGHSNDAVRTDPAVSEKSFNPDSPGEVSSQKIRPALEPEDARLLSAEPESLCQAMNVPELVLTTAAESGGTNECFVPGVEDSNEKAAYMSSTDCRRNTAVSPAKPLTERSTKGMMAYFSFTNTATVDIRTRGDWLPRTPEDIVLLGAPPSMINYLIVFSPLLVLQALQQIAGLLTTEDTRGSTHTPPDSRGTRGESRQEAKERDNQNAGKGDASLLMGLQVVSQDPRSSETAVSDVISHSLPPPSTRKPFEDDTCGKTACIATIEGGHVVCGDSRGRKESEEFMNYRTIDNVPEDCLQPEPGGNAATACQRSTPLASARAPATAHGETTAAAEVGDERAEAQSEGCRAAQNCSTSISRALQAELRSALCWADRGLCSLFRASSSLPAAPSNACTCTLSVESQSQHSNSPTRQTIGTDANGNLSDEVTPELLTTALLLLTKQSEQCGHSGKMRLCALPQIQRDSWTDDAASTAEAQLASRRVHAGRLSYPTSELVSFLTTMLNELDRRELLRQNGHRTDYSDKDAAGRMHPREEGEALEDDNVPTENVSCTLSPVALTNPNDCAETRTRTDASEVSRRCDFTSPSLLPSPSADDNDNASTDSRRACFHTTGVKEGGASVFFAPLHYQRQGCLLYGDGKRLQANMNALQELLPVHAVSSGCAASLRETAARVSPPVGDCDVTQSPLDDERTREYDLAERVALEILARVDDVSFFHDEDALDTELMRTDIQRCHGASGPHIPDDDYGESGRGRNQTVTGTTHWLREDAHLLSARRDHGEDGKIKKLHLGTSGRDAASQIMEGRDRNPPKCCSSQDPHDQDVGRVYYHRTAEVRDTALKAQSRVSTEQSLCSHYMMKRGYGADDALSTRELAERAIDSAVQCSDFFEGSLRAESERTHRRHAHVATKEFRRYNAFHHSRLLCGDTVSEMTDSCMRPEGAGCGEKQRTVISTDRSNKPFHSAADTETALSARDAPHTSVLGEEAPWILRAANCPSEVRKTSGSPVCTRKPDFSERREDKDRPCAGYTGNDDASIACALKIGRAQDQPRDPDTEESEPRRRSQQRETDPAWTGQRTEIRRNPPRSACSRAESSSSVSRVSDLQRLTSDRPGSAADDANKWTWEDVEDKESSANTGSLESAHTIEECERRTLAEDEGSTHEGQAGRTFLPWHGGSTEGRQRFAHTVETSEAGSGENGKEEPDCRRKQPRPDAEDDGSGCKQYSVQSRRNSTLRVETGVAVSSLEKEALKTTEAASRRTSSAVYSDGGGRNGSWTEGNHKTSLRNLGTEDEIHAGLDTRRPMRGVYFDRSQRSWIGSFYEDRRQIKKRFKVDTYGFLRAKALAVDVRLGYERRMLRGVVGAAGCAEPSKAQSIPHMDSPTSVGNATSSSLQVEEISEPEMVDGDRSAEIWMRSVTNTSTEQQLSLLRPQERETRQDRLAIRSKSSPDAVRNHGLQAESSTCVPESQASCLDTPPALGAPARIPSEKLAAATLTARYEEAEAAPVKWVDLDHVAGKWSGSGTSLRPSFASKALGSHVVFSSDLQKTALDGENARVHGAGGCRRVLQNGSQEAVELGEVECTLFDSRDTLGNRSRIEVHALHGGVGSAKIHARDVFSFQNRDDTVEKPIVRGGTSLKAENEYPSHTYIRKTAAHESTFYSRPGHEKRKRHTQEGRYIEGSESIVSDFLAASGKELSRADTGGKSEETGRTLQQRAVREDGCIAKKRKSSEGKGSQSGALSSECVGEEARFVSVQTGAHGRVEDPAEEDAVLVPTSAGKYQDACAKLTHRDTAGPSVPSSLHRRIGSRTTASSTEEKRNFSSGRLEDSLWSPPLKMKSSHAGAGKGASGKEEADVEDRERGPRTSTSFASTSYTSTSVTENISPRGHEHETSNGIEPAMHLRRGKTLAPSFESSADVDGARRSNPCKGAHSPEAKSSLFTPAPSSRRSFCSRSGGTQYWPIRPSNKKPADAATAAYMFSKRKKRPVDLLCESGGGATPLFGQDLPLGVFYTSKKHAYCANWYEGKRQLKRYFPICKLGEPEARRLAIAARREAERREREARCRTGGGAFTLTACTEKRDLFSAGPAEHELPTDSSVKAVDSPSKLGRREASEDSYACQMEQL